MKSARLLILIVLLAVLLACNLPSLTVPTPNAIEQPAAPTVALLPLATATSAPLWQQVTLTVSTSEETGKAPDYTIKTQVPVLTGSDDPRVQKFNSAVTALVQHEIDGFKSGVAQLPATPISAGSSLENGVELLSPPGDILSLNFGFYTYSDGAAHPFSYTLTYNYDLAKGQEISLDQLFLPNSNYLEALASYCKTELSKRDIGFDEVFAQGADPTPENYRSWNITTEGLKISFDPYQVAPYAAGPQVVTIPYVELSNLIDPNGPLGTYK